MDVQWIGSTLLLSLIGALGAGDEGWSMQLHAEVRAQQGFPVLLPCSFSHPQRAQHAALRVEWRLGPSVLFRCSSAAGAPGCEPGPRQDRRYRLEGNPREHDLSLRISGAALQDSGRYYCRVQVQGRDHVSFEDKMGTRLRVEAPPRIQALLVEGSAHVGFRALCRVQGSPLPDVQWLGPDDLLVGSSPPDGSSPPALGSEGHFLTVSQLAVTPGRRYTCSASNPLGRDQAALYFLPPPRSVGGACSVGGASPLLLLLLSLSLGAKVLLLVATWVLVLRGGALQGAGCWGN